MKPGPRLDRGAATAALLAVLVAVGTLARAASAQDEAGPTVRGSVTGELVRGSQARFRVTASHPEGWRSVDEVIVVLELRGAPLEEVAYDVSGSVISVGGTRAVAGTGNAVAGRFFRVGAFGVELATGGNRLDLSFGAQVLADVPRDARFRFVADDDEGRSASVTVRAAVPEEEGGLSLTTVVLAAVGALLAGGYLGARVATHRRRPSIYESVARRITEEREARTRPPRG